MMSYEVVIAGLTVIDGFEDPLFQRKEDPVISLFAEMVVLSPAHKILSLTFKVITGKGLTVISTLCDVVQPSGLVPVTEYVLVLFGLTMIERPFCPLFHKKDVPDISELTFMVAEAPLQISLAEVVRFRMGNGLTIIVVCAMLIHD